MEDRRLFLKKSALTLMTLSMPMVFSCKTGATAATAKMNPKKPEKAVVFWYSQTGNTERAGRLIAETLKKNGLEVEACEYRDMDPASVANFDLIIAGSPVYYYDVPANFKKWLRALPGIEGIPCAAYVTFGGTGGNQHNTACTLLELLADKGGAPVGMETFGNMPTFAITWSSGNVDRVLKYRHLPNEDSFDKMRDFASRILSRVQEGKDFEIDKEVDFRDLIKSTPSIWSTKLFISRHTIDAEKCIECGACAKKCPVAAIDLSKHSVDTDRCIACLGCVNNCPVQAVDMAFMGKEVYGYTEFVRRNRIQVHLPKELKAD
ncbi:MAG: EFR1 family ferrodoxin [Desulfosalsimonadaceae bacterium]|nr:EFR1 family ferrodoxin [Desulfosalsimonadaceae bacterium]